MTETESSAAVADQAGFTDAAGKIGLAYYDCARRMLNGADALMTSKQSGSTGPSQQGQAVSSEDIWAF